MKVRRGRADAGVASRDGKRRNHRRRNSVARITGAGITDAGVKTRERTGSESTNPDPRQNYYIKNS